MPGPGFFLRNSYLEHILAIFWPYFDQDSTLGTPLLKRSLAWTDVSGLPLLHTFHWTMYGGVEVQPPVGLLPCSVSWPRLRELHLTNHNYAWSPHFCVPVPTGLVEFKMRTRSIRCTRIGPTAVVRRGCLSNFHDEHHRGDRHDARVFGAGL